MSDVGHRSVRAWSPVLMCACEPDFVCSLCRDTPQDWRYELDEPEPEREQFAATVEDDPARGESWR